MRQPRFKVGAVLAIIRHISVKGKKNPNAPGYLHWMFLLAELIMRLLTGRIIYHVCFGDKQHICIHLLKFGMTLYLRVKKL